MVNATMNENSQKSTFPGDAVIRRHNRLVFVFFYLFAKIRVLWEVRSPRFEMFLFEAEYSITNAIRTLLPKLRRQALWRFETELIATKFGAFRIRPATMDAAIISPAFERQDVDLLLTLVGEALRSGKGVLFLDV